MKPFNPNHTTAPQHSNQRHIVYRLLDHTTVDPARVHERAQDCQAAPTLLESGTRHSQDGRYSHCSLHPLVTCHSRSQHITFDYPTHCQRTSTHCVISELRRLQQRYRAHCQAPLPHFASALVGFVTYDAVRLLESIPDNNPESVPLPDVHFTVYQDHITYDHLRQQVQLATVVIGDPSEPSVQQQAEKRLAVLHRMVEQAPPRQPPEAAVTPQPSTDNSADAVSVDIKDSEFILKVKQAQHGIRQGDIFQAVLSRQFTVPCPAPPSDVYRHLKHTNPEAYLFHLACNGSHFVGASPEKLVLLHQGTLQSSPLAGTRPRHRDPLVNQQRAQELINDPKENAEHTMLVDLARNDLGKIATVGSVHVTQLKQLEHTSHVMHLSSTVTATLAPQYDALDALFNCLPAGTLSGAPKIRAMQIIDELETTRRGLYGGTVAAIDNHGNMISCIAIRMATLTNNTATVRAGAGIVMNSDPATEALETRHKANTVLSAIAAANAQLKEVMS